MSTASSVLAALAAWALVVLAPSGVYAQSATLSMTADRTEVALGEALRLQIRSDIVGSNAPEPELPDLSAFEIVSRQTARPMQFSMGWGGQQPVVQSTTIITFLLRPRREGRVQLTPARVTMQGRTFQSNPLTIVVGPPGAAPPPPSPTSPVVPMNPPTQVPTTPATPTVDATHGTDAYVFDDRAFLRTVVDEREPYVGQQITVTIYLYVRQGLSQSPAASQEPTSDGFWVRDLLPAQRTLDPRTQVIQGVPFQTITMRRFAAFPLREGDLTIGPLSLSVPQGTPFDALLGQAQPPLERTSTPLSIHARALPEAGRPSGDVHVGTLRLEVTADRTQVPTGDAITVTLRASGTGQIDSLHFESPSVPGLQVLSPQIDTEMTTPGDRVTGTRSVEWLVVPEQPGTHVIPPFRVSVFDPQTGAYSVAESAAITITAAGNATTPAPEPTPDVGTTDTPDAAPLGPVRTNSQLERHRTHLARQPWFPWATAVFPIAWVAFLAVRAMQRRAQSASERVTPAKVAREAKKRLDAAEERAKANDARGFYGALSLAMSAVIEGKLGESIGALTRPQLRRRLVERGMSEALAQKVATELEGADFARYATSGGASTEMDAALARTREILGEVDRFVATDPED